MSMKNGGPSLRCVLSELKVPVTFSEDEILSEAKKRFLKCSGDFSDFRISKLSVDARKKEDVKYVASVSAVYTGDPCVGDRLAKFSRFGISPMPEPGRPVFPGRCKAPAAPPVVAGFGPAGMFAALILAEAGFSPVVAERGECVEERAASVERFLSGGTFDPASNIQFGAGGAGTFSDGKLVTRINDGFCGYVLERFVEFGAPEEILYRAKPHIGTDKLRNIVSGIADRIVSLGGTILYNSQLIGISADRGHAEHILLGDGRHIDCSALVLAVGHSARDTYRYLISKGYSIEAKPFSVGVRIEHLTEDIDSAMYGRFAGLPNVPHAEYNLSCRTGEGDRGVYTFCMCPGGQVVAAASELGGVVTNGMSRFARDGRNSNSAVAVSVNPADYGGTPDGAMEFQRRIERAAFFLSGENYSAPAQTVGSFLGKTSANRPTRVLPTYRDGGVEFTDIGRIFPDFAVSALSEGLAVFGRRIRGFDADHAILTGPETRTSAPLRILRGEDRCALGYDNIYPTGEGAGYAGGITSAAVDGIRTALAIIERFSCRG